MKYIIEKYGQVVFPKIYEDVTEAQSKAAEMAKTFDDKYVVHRLVPVNLTS
jgi:hypothetical protein